MEGLLRWKKENHYFVLWETTLYQWKKKPAKTEMQKRLASADKKYDLSKLRSMETDPSQRHVLILNLPDNESITLAARNPGSYQAWLSCFAIFHVAASMRSEQKPDAPRLPFVVPSCVIKAIWTTLDDILWRGCQTANIFKVEGERKSSDHLLHLLLTQGPKACDPSDSQVYTVAEVAKRLLFSLPESLWTDFLVPQIARMTNVKALRNVLIGSVPEQNFEMLKKLFITLSSIALNPDAKMTAKSLAEIIAPTLSSRTDPGKHDLTAITEMCISNYRQLFHGAPKLVVVIPRIEDILTYKRLDVRRKTGRRGRAAAPRKSSLTSSDDDSDNSTGSGPRKAGKSRKAQKETKFLRPTFPERISARGRAGGRGRSQSMFSAPDAERPTFTISGGASPATSDDRFPSSSSRLSQPEQVTLFATDKEEKEADSADIFGFGDNMLTIPTTKSKRNDRLRSMSMVVGENNEDFLNQTYNDIRGVVGKRRSKTTRLVKSLETPQFLVYGYQSEDDRSRASDGLYKPKRLSTRHRIAVPIAEESETDLNVARLNEQNRKTELLEVFGSVGSIGPPVGLPRNSNRKSGSPRSRPKRVSPRAPKRVSPRAPTSLKPKPASSSPSPLRTIETSEVV